MPSQNKPYNPFDEDRILGITPEEATRSRKQWMDDLIIDSAREPLIKIEQSQTMWGAQRLYLWYHVLRPCVLLALWLFVLWYVWAYFFDVRGGNLRNAPLLLLYALIIGVIFTMMQGLAYIRYLYQSRAMGRMPQAATTTELALYAMQQETTVLLWQRARMANAHHDASGALVNVDVLIDPRQPRRGRVVRLLKLAKAP